MTEITVASESQMVCLDQPIVVQFFKYVGNMLKGDLGVSYNISKNTPISQLIQTRLPISIRIGGRKISAAPEMPLLSASSM